MATINNNVLYCKYSIMKHNLLNYIKSIGCPIYGLCPMDTGF